MDLYRPTRILAPVPSGVSCTTLQAGCRAVDFTYATSTTATGTTAATWGDYLGRLKEITFTAWDPDLSTPAMRTVAVADYTYDNTGKLRSTWDPRLDYTDAGGSHHVADTYDYNSDGILATITPAGQQPWQLTYTTIPGDSGKGRLASVSRSALGAGTATTTVVYKVPTDNTGPDDLSTGQTARWGQTEPPVDATAIYPATQVPDGNQATGVLPSSAERATIYYLNADGRETNVADPSGHIDTLWYDKYGNTVRQLDGGNLEEALSASTTDTTAQEAALALRYSTINTYSGDGQQLLDTVQPEHDVVLPDWSSVRGRTHTHNVYDEGAPSGGPYNLVTTSTTTVRYTVNGVDTDTDARTTTTDYNWTLRQPTTKSVDPSGLNLTTRTAYDATTALVTSTTAPEGGTSTTTPATRTTVYYRAGTGSGYTELRQPTRVGQPALPGATRRPTRQRRRTPGHRHHLRHVQPAAHRHRENQHGDPADHHHDLRHRWAALRHQHQRQRPRHQPAHHPPDVRPGHRPTPQDPVGGLRQRHRRNQPRLRHPRPAHLLHRRRRGRLHHHLRHPQPNRHHHRRESHPHLHLRRRHRTPRPTHPDRRQSDRHLHRQLRRTRQNRPPNLAHRRHHQPVLRRNRRSHWHRIPDQQQLHHLQLHPLHQLHRPRRPRPQPMGLQHPGLLRLHLRQRRPGRLADAAHTTTAGCILREYTLDTATNRTKLARYGPEPTNCADTTLIDTHTSTYDAANRITNSGYTYDALGRTLTIPSADTANNAGTTTVTYHVNDLVDTITQNGRTTDYTLDAIADRVRSWTDTTTGSTAHVNHYDGDDDNPSWTQETATTYTRPFAGVAGMAGIYNSSSASIDYQVTNLHGDAVATIHNSATGLSTTQSATEYGTLNSSSNIGTVRYGWLGSKQRAADTPAGVVLMGVRPYNTATGRFITRDPVPGGSCNTYEYTCADPINNQDLDGRACILKSLCKAISAGAKKVAKAVQTVKAVAKVTVNKVKAQPGCYAGVSGAGCKPVRAAMNKIGKDIGRAYNKYYCNLGGGAPKWVLAGVITAKAGVRAGMIGWAADGVCLLTGTAAYK